METNDCWLLVIISANLKVNNLVLIDTKVDSDSIQESFVVLLFNIEKILIVSFLLNALSHKLVDDMSGHDWLQMSFFIWLELISSVEMDTE